jgi:GNAT superfamily N-acetyltransferase
MSAGAGLVQGPFPITPADIPALNVVFSEAFTERYRRDGMVGVRVPTLNPAIWRYALDDAGDGAMLWRDDAGDIVAFNVAHVSGHEGWMGPLAVRTERQGTGLGRRIVQAAIAHLKAQGVRTIGLETMPRTVDNIGFYVGLGFVPGALTVTATVEAAAAPPADRLGRLDAAEQVGMLAACHALTGSVAPGVDFRGEIDRTRRGALGDTLLLRDGGTLRGFALCHAAPLVEGRAREELRVLKLVLADAADLPALLALVAGYARESGTRRAAFRVQTAQAALLPAMAALGARVRWTDLRMTLAGFPEDPPAHGVVLSNWEI